MRLNVLTFGIFQAQNVLTFVFLFSKKHSDLITLRSTPDANYSLDEASFVLGTLLNIEENDACFFFASSVIFLNAET